MDEREFWKNERVAFLALTTLKGIGYWTLHKIAEQGVGFKNALKEPGKYGLERYYPKSSDAESVQSELWAKGLEMARYFTASGIRIYFRGEPGFPEKLRAIPDAPHWIFVQGNPSNLNQPAIAVVGTRRPTGDGLFLTKFVMAAISKINCVSVSGLALGIDQTCHAESLRYSIPTIAVLGTGILNNYPKGSDILREEILVAGGAIVSEYLPNQSYSPENFVRRNRLQAALGDVLIPVEWSPKSGTAHTVRYANSYGRKIINIYLPYTRGGRPEIEFSVHEYGAPAFEAPLETDLLVSEITAAMKDYSGGGTNNNMGQCSEVTQEPRQENLDIFSDDIGEDPQLSLI